MHGIGQGAKDVLMLEASSPPSVSVVYLQGLPSPKISIVLREGICLNLVSRLERFSENVREQSCKCSVFKLLIRVGRAAKTLIN